MTTRQLGVVQQQVGRSTGKATWLLEVTRDQDEVCYIYKDLPVTQLQDRVEIDTDGSAGSRHWTVHGPGVQQLRPASVPTKGRDRRRGARACSMDGPVEHSIL